MPEPKAVEIGRGDSRLTDELTSADIMSSQGSVWAQMFRSTANEDPTTIWQAMLSDRAMMHYRDMEEKDGHYSSQLETRKEGVLSLPRRVMPASDSALDQKIADAVEDMIAKLKDCDNVLYELLDALGKGVSVAEIMWEAEGREVRPVELRFRPQEWFAFGERFGPAVGALRLSDEQAGTGDAEPFPLNKFAVHSFRPHLGNRWGRPLGRRCFWAFWFKKQDIKFWLKFIEKGTGTVITKFNRGAKDDEKGAALKAAENINAETAVAIPADFPVEILEKVRQGGGNTYLDLAEQWANREMSNVILGQVLTSSGSDQGSGSLALGEVHNEVRKEKKEVDARSLMRVVNEQIIGPFVTLNFGPAVERPRWVIDFEEGEDQLAISERDDRLARLGVPIPHSYFRERYELPEPQDGEDVVQIGTGGGEGGEFAEFEGDDPEPGLVAGMGVRGARGLYASWIQELLTKAAAQIPEREQ